MITACDIIKVYKLQEVVHMKQFFKKLYDVMLNGPSLKSKDEEEKTVIDYTDTAKIAEGKAIWRQLEQYKKSVDKDEIDHQMVFEQTRKAALLGCTDAQLMLNFYYSLGKGTPKNPAESKRWLLEAANHGHAHAQSLVGDGCRIGIYGMKRDRQEAYRWYHLSARQDYADAWFKLSEMHSDYKYPEERDERKSFEYCKKAAELGSSYAVYKLAEKYRYGKGTDTDINRAVECYMQAVEMNNDYAMRALAYMYKKGDNLEQNLEEAFRLYKLAADQGDIQAKYEVAEMYRRGEGTPKDVFAAEELYVEISPNHEQAKKLMVDIIFLMDEAIQADGPETRDEYMWAPVTVSAEKWGREVTVKLNYPEYKKRMAEAFEKYEQQEKETQEKKTGQ